MSTLNIQNTQRNPLLIISYFLVIMTKMTERDLNKNILSYLKDKETYVYSEIPFLSRIIDIIVLKDNCIYSYELKLKNWKRALEQLKDQRIASTYSILCMPDQHISEDQKIKIIKELDFYGFGLKLWNTQKSELIEKLQPKPNKIVNHIFTEKLKSNIKYYQ